MPRNRFKRARIASSDNYELSRKLHAEYLMEQHLLNVIVIKQITSTIKCAYARVFGELIPISVEEARKVEQSVTVIWI